MLVVMGAFLWILVVRSDNDREKGMHGIVGFFLVVIVFVRHREGWDIGRPMLLWTRNRFFVSFIISLFIHSFSELMVLQKQHRQYCWSSWEKQEHGIKQTSKQVSNAGPSHLPAWMRRGGLIHKLHM